MTEDERARAELIRNFPLYSETALNIKTKGGGLKPFKLNRAQRYIHEIAEKQLKDFGYIRVLILKGRQQGCSTYVQGRLYWRVSQRKGVNALVVAHNRETTKMLFAMTRLMHEECPEILKPHTHAASTEELEFDEIRSGYKVATAKSVDGGRGGTFQFLHGSEIGLWDKGYEIFAGLGQAIPSGTEIGGSEVFLESTAKGPGGLFYDLWMSATSEDPDKRNEYIAIFTPWWWQDEYCNPIESSDPIVWDDEEKKYKDSYKLSDGQMLWRRYKILSMGMGGDALFKQEYPATAKEAFDYSVEGAWFDSEYIMEAMKDKDFKRSLGARVGALDPGGENKDSDRTAIGHGDDLAIDNLEYWPPSKPYQIRERAELYIKEHDLQVLYVDANGIGAGIYSEMSRGAYKHIVRPYIGSNETSTFIDGQAVYANKRAESHGRLREWIGDGKFVQIPDSVELRIDILTPKETEHKTSRRKIVESKDDIRKRGGKSPDGLDVLVMIKSEFVRKDLTKHDGYDTVIDTDYDVLNYGLD